MRASFAWRLYSSYAALVLLTSLSIGGLVHERLRASLAQEQERSLVDGGVMLEPLARRSLSGEDLGEVFREIGAHTELRITLVSSTGSVVADSHEDPRGMENHANRAELLLAAKSDRGVSRRFSQTLRIDMLYVARALRDAAGEIEGFIRVSMPLRDTEAQLAGLRRDIVVGGGLGIVLALLLGLWMTRRITRPIGDITRVADALRAGDYSSRVATLPANELGRLGETLNRLAREITTRIQAISRDDAQLRAMLVTMVEGVLAVDQDDSLLFCNASAREFLGIDTADSSGAKIWEVVRHADLIELLESVRKTGAVERREFEIDHGPRRVVLQALANPFEVEHERGLVVVLHDITDLRRLENVRRDFVANVSHELKTPLTSIQGYVETLLNGALGDEDNNHKFVERIQSNAQRLNYLVTDLLSLARIESSAEGLQLSAIDLWSTVCGAAVRHEPTWTGKNLTVEWHGRPSEAVVRAEHEGLVQVIDNLLTNAIRYSRAEGRIELRVSASDGFGILEVEDDGVGIPMAEQSRIFERFYRVDKARSREIGGTGLGLSIVKHLVAAMSGTVEVVSEVDRGTTFTVRIPLAG